SLRPQYPTRKSGPASPQMRHSTSPTAAMPKSWSYAACPRTATPSRTEYPDTPRSRSQAVRFPAAPALQECVSLLSYDPFFVCADPFLSALAAKKQRSCQTTPISPAVARTTAAGRFPERASPPATPLRLKYQLLSENFEATIHEDFGVPVPSSPEFSPMP